MKRKAAEESGLICLKKVKENTHHHIVFLDLNYSSNLLSTKIADIPHKLKYETIIAPIFEYCFGTSDQVLVWEPLTEKQKERYYDEKDIYKYSKETNASQKRILYLTIDWIRDETFIYNQIFNLVVEKVNIIGMKFGLWYNSRKFIMNAMDNFTSEILCYATFTFLTDKELVIEAVKAHGKSLARVSDRWTNDKQVVMQAVMRDGLALEFASAELRNDLEIVLKSLESNPYAYMNASYGLRLVKEVVLKAVSVRGLVLKYITSELRNDREVVIQAIQQNALSFEYASNDLKNDREIVKIAIMKNGECLRFASKPFMDDKEIVELALKSSPDAFHYISARLWKEESELILKIIGKRGFKMLPKQFSNDRDIVVESTKLNSRNIEYSSRDLQNDRDFVLQLVKNNGRALEYVKEEFRNDREIVLEAITQNGNALSYVPDQFLKDREIILKATETATLVPNLFERMESIFEEDKELYMKCGVFIDKFPRLLKIESELAKEILEKTPRYFIDRAYSFVSRDRTLAIQIVKRNGFLLCEMPFKYRNDRELVTFAIQQNKKAFKFISDELKNDLEILKLYNGLLGQ